MNLNRRLVPPLAALTLLLAGCSSGPQGTYKDEMGLASYTFKSGTVTVSMMGTETEMPYRVEDGKVKIGGPQGAMVLAINSDGSLQGPMGMKLVKD